MGQVTRRCPQTTTFGQRGVHRPHPLDREVSTDQNLWTERCPQPLDREVSTDHNLWTEKCPQTTTFGQRSVHRLQPLDREVSTDHNLWTELDPQTTTFGQRKGPRCMEDVVVVVIVVVRLVSIMPTFRRVYRYHSIYR